MSLKNPEQPKKFICFAQKMGKKIEATVQNSELFCTITSSEIHDKMHDKMHLYTFSLATVSEIHIQFAGRSSRIPK